MAFRSPRKASAVRLDLVEREADPVDSSAVAGVADVVPADPAEAAGVAGNRSFVFGNQAKEPDVKSGSFLLPRGSCRSRELMARALRGGFFMRPGWRFGPFVFGTSNARQ